MPINQPKYNNLFSSLIWIGLIGFVMLFLLASSYYPGGSNNDPNSLGYDWSKNYWSELLGYNAKNGHRNPSRPFGIGGAIAFAFSMSVFWIYIPLKLELNQLAKRSIQWFGLLAMVCSVLIFGQSHDVFITLSVTFGSIAFLMMLVGLWQSKQLVLFWWCCLCLILILLNTFIYMSGWWIDTLPVLQKITFACGICWTAYTTLVLNTHS